MLGELSTADRLSVRANIMDRIVEKSESTTHLRHPAMQQCILVAQHDFQPRQAKFKNRWSILVARHDFQAKTGKIQKPALSKRSVVGEWLTKNKANRKIPNKQIKTLEIKFNLLIR